MRDSIWCALMILTLCTLVAVDRWWKCELEGLSVRITTETARVERIETLLGECELIYVMNIPMTNTDHIVKVCPRGLYLAEEN